MTSSAESLDSHANRGVTWVFPDILMILVVAVGLLTVLPFSEGLSYMWYLWMTVPEYSHGVLIPPLVAFLIWQRKDRLQHMEFAGSWLGPAIVACGGILLALGQLGTVYVIVQYAYLVTLFGLVLALMGRKAAHVIAIPLVMLIFMIPLPTFVLSNLSAELQLISSQLGVWVIRLFGISVFVEGNVIDLGGYKLQVAEACNGLRYLFPLMTIGFLMAYFYKGATWKRIFLFFSSIAIAVLMNSLRIGSIGVMVEHWGIQMAEGFLHEFQGWAVFMVSASLLLGEMILLNRIGHETGTWRELFNIEFPGPTSSAGTVRRRAVPRPFIFSCLILAGIAIMGFGIPRAIEIIPKRINFAYFPMSFGGWVGHKDSLEGIYVDALKLDDYLLVNFSEISVPPVNLYIAYYNSQRKGEAVHSPRTCLPGGGWRMTNFKQRTLKNIIINGHPLRVNRTLIELGTQRQLVYYWFEQRGRLVTNEFAVKWFLFFDALTRHRTDGGLVRVITGLPPGSDEADADRRLVSLLQYVAPVLNSYIPN